ncbi:MAG: thiamine phosphate synthase, partial [Firmicutes bacterium]|nr:thiamine phosphate synthase [Bacillota bacterium]
MTTMLHVLMDPGQVRLADIPAFCQAIRQGGASVVQLRGKKSTTRELIIYGQALRQATQACALRLVVNDRVDVALAVSADGVHVGQDDMPVDRVRRLAPHLWVGLSVSTAEELEEARRTRPDYIGLGP